MPCIGDMPNIKQYLKNVGITQKEFAERIGLSRPTLDTYIEMYQEGQRLPKERYDIIFKRLFENENCTAEEFLVKLNKAEELLNRDQKYGTSDLEPEAADYVSLIVRSMNKDLKVGNWSKDVYAFINILITNYRKNEIFQQLVEYFIYLNGIRDIEKIEETQIPYLANMFKTFHNLTENPKNYSTQDYEEFLDRCLEIKAKKKRRSEERKDELKRRIQNMITKYEQKGVELDEDEILDALKKQLILEKLDNGGKT